MTLVVFDTETTGFLQGHLVELAAVIYTPDGQSYTYHSRCKPSSPIEDGAAAVHGLTNFMVQHERPDTEVVAEFMADLNEVHKPEFGALVMGGHNSAYDLRILRKYTPIDFDTPIICTMRLGRLYSPEAENHKLVTLHNHLGCTGNYKAHSALDDVYMSFNILKHYMTAKGLGYLDFAKIQSKPSNLKIMPFGKHKGSCFSVIPLSYMNYMLGLSDIDADVANNLRQEIARREGK
jgi:DNA polymerase-3 subunit epsilon